MTIDRDARRLRGFPGSRPSEIALDGSQVQALFLHLQVDAIRSWQGRRLRLLIALLLETGIYLDTQALALRRDGFDHEGRTLRVSQFRPPLAISGELTDEIARWLREDNPRSEWIFPNLTMTDRWKSDSGPLGSRTGDEIRRAGLAAEIPYLTSEVLRFQHIEAIGEMPEGYLELPEGFRGDPGPTPPPKADPPTLASASRLMARLKVRSARWEEHLLFALAAIVLLSDLPKAAALRLKVTEIDIEARLFRCPGRDPVPISDELAEILSGWLARVAALTPWAFPGTKLQGPWLGGTCGRKATDRLRWEAEEAGCGPITFRDLKDIRTCEGGRVHLGGDYRRLTMPEPRPGAPTPGTPGPRQGTRLGQCLSPRSRPHRLEANTTKVSSPSPTKADPWDGWDEAQCPVEILEGRLFLFGSPKGPIRKAAAEVLRPLIEEYPRPKLLSDLQLKAGDAWGIIDRLRKKYPEAEAAILVPRKRNNGSYRIGRPNASSYTQTRHFRESPHNPSDADEGAAC